MFAQTPCPALSTTNDHLHSMDRFYPDNSPESLAQAHIAAYVYWDANIGPNQIGLCAAYASLARYVQGEGVYIPPRSIQELKSILRNYSDHIINSLGSQVKSRPARDGYAQAREISARSLKAVLSCPENVQYLLELHTVPAVDQPSNATVSGPNDNESFEPSSGYGRIRSN